jgi:hypothetical protein
METGICACQDSSWLHINLIRNQQILTSDVCKRTNSAEGIGAKSGVYRRSRAGGYRGAGAAVDWPKTPLFAHIEGLFHGWGWGALKPLRPGDRTNAQTSAGPDHRQVSIPRD